MSRGGRANWANTQKQLSKGWPFVESPLEFTTRLRAALVEFDDMLAAVRHVLIEVPPQLVPPPHRHRIADARNEAVQSGYVCVDCGAVFEAADHGAKGPAKEPTSPDEPFWYAVVSDEAPTINKAFRRADVADRYASICRENGYPLAELVPLYRRPSGAKEVPDAG